MGSFQICSRPSKWCLIRSSNASVHLKIRPPVLGSVGMKIFLIFFFWKAKEIAGLSQKKNRIGRVSGNTGIFFLGIKPRYPLDIPGPIGAVVTKDWGITIFCSSKGDKLLYSHLSLKREWPSIVARGRIIPLKFEQYSGLTQWV